MLRGIICLGFGKSQSLWVRDRFLMEGEEYDFEMIAVAIPLGQGKVFNRDTQSSNQTPAGRNPFGSGTGF